MRSLLVTVVAGLGLAACATAPGGDDLTGRPAHELATRIGAGELTSEALTRAYLSRIEAVDRSGARLQSVLALNPRAIADARAADAERKAGRVRGPLHGLPILIKDNIETRELPTTAGSLALAANATGRDAPLVARLRAAGAVVLGKTNLSEWANFRSTESTSGWSAVGGLTRNPHALDRNGCGSSTGSGVAAAAGLAAAAIGTETDGSVTCPAAVNGAVGFKPTVGLVSRTHVVPIASSQDTAGPMTRSVRDAALLLTAMAGSDPADPATAEADRRRTDYAAALRDDALKGRRIGVLRYAAGFDAGVGAVFDQALATMRAAGADLVEIKTFKAPGPVAEDKLGDDEPEGDDKLGDAEFAVLLAEFKDELNAYLATTPPTVKTRTLAQLIEFNKANAATEMPLFGQEIFVQAEATKGKNDPAYLKARAAARRMAGAEGIDRLLREHKVELLVAPTVGPAWMTDLVNGDQYSGGSASQLPAVAGYPHLTVPMGQVQKLPVGLSFIGTAWSDAAVLSAGHAFEQRAKASAAPGLAPTSEALAPIAPAVRPRR
jgi:amidase